MSLLLGLRNFATQTITTFGFVGLGNVYRRYCKKNSCTVDEALTNATVREVYEYYKSENRLM